MPQNAYLLAKIGADTAENEQHFAEILCKKLATTRRRMHAMDSLAATFGPRWVVIPPPQFCRFIDKKNTTKLVSVHYQLSESFSFVICLLNIQSLAVSYTNENINHLNLPNLKPCTRRAPICI